MKNHVSLSISRRASRPLGVMTLIVGMIGAVALAATTPSAQAAASTSAARVQRVSPPAAHVSRSVAPEMRGGWTQANEISVGISAVAISGHTMVVGADGDNSNIGAAYVYTGSGSTWNRVATLTPSDGQDDDSFG